MDEHFGEHLNIITVHFAVDGFLIQHIFTNAHILHSLTPHAALPYITVLCHYILSAICSAFSLLFF